MAGSIEKRGKNSYRLTVSEGFDLNGKPMIHRKTVHGNKKDAEVELAKFVTEVQNGLVIDGKSLKFSEFIKIWKRDYGSKELAPPTYKRYCRMLKTRLLPYFGHFYINKIKPTGIMKFYDLLEEYKLWYEEQKSIYGELWTDSDSLFVQADSKPMHPSTISKWFVKYVGQIGLPVINFHGLRHTNASLLVAQNIDIAVISARLGHAQISTTLDFYVHPLLSHNRKAGYALENLLLPTRS